MTRKLLISDLDGTLLNEKQKISRETSLAIKEAQKAGIKCLIATGRSWSTASALLKEAGIACDAILLNGAEFRDEKGRLLKAENFPQKEAVCIIEELLRQGINVEINTQEGDYSTNIEFCSTASPMPSLEELRERQAVMRKIFAFSNDKLKLETIKQRFTERKELTITSSAEWNVEITAARAKKGRMAQIAADFYGVTPQEVWVFGDGENDRSLFELFPHSCAMGNAVFPLRQMAEKVIESNAENGVAKEIRRYLKNLSKNNG